MQGERNLPEMRVKDGGLGERGGKERSKSGWVENEGKEKEGRAEDRMGSCRSWASS